MKAYVKILASLGLMVCGIITCFVQTSLAQTDNQIEQYIETYKSIAEEEMIRTGVPAAVSLAQGIVESQAGTGWLATHANNQFGIKCKVDWNGPSVLHNDDVPNECFRAYEDPDSSWRDHSDFLRSSPRYAFLFSLDPLDYKAWAHGLKRAGYATSGTYAQQLINTIQTWHLEQYSEQAFAQMKNAPQNAFAAMLDKKVEEDRKAMGIVAHKPVPAPKSVQKVTAASPYPEGLFQINGRHVIFLPSGTQLISIAEKYHIRLSRLVRFNELDSDVLDKNMLIYLQKKKKTGADETHTVSKGETWHQIAQEEGIRLKWLRKRNRIGMNEVLQPGEVLYLHGYAPEEKQSFADNSQTSARKKKNKWQQKLSDLLSQQKKDTASSVAAVVDSSSNKTADKTTRQPDQPLTQTAATYKVRRGDTLYNISKRYGVTVEEIQRWNHLDGTTIKTGETLIISKK